MKRICLACLVIMLSGCFGSGGLDGSSDQEIEDPIKKTNGIIQIVLVSILKNIFDDNPDQVTEAPTVISEADGLTAKEILIKYWPLTYEEHPNEKITAENLKKEAGELLAKKQYNEAIEKYEQLSSIPFGKEAAEAGKAAAKKSMIEFIEKMDYFDKVQITEFTAMRIETYLGEKTPVVRISLKNRGNRSLDSVTVLVHFNDKDGNAIYEETFNPVYAADNKPLKPGYIKEMSEGKFYIIDSKLSEWEEGNAAINIVDLEFSEH